MGLREHLNCELFKSFSSLELKIFPAERLGVIERDDLLLLCAIISRHCYLTRESNFALC